MAYWDSKKRKIVYRHPKKVKNYKYWYEIDCGCCNGIKWGGPNPKECERCRGNGTIFWHSKSKVFALYIGGPLLGKGNIDIKKEEYE